MESVEAREVAAFLSIQSRNLSAQFDVSFSCDSLDLFLQDHGIFFAGYSP
jgi:hypothetical protein